MTDFHDLSYACAICGEAVNRFVEAGTAQTSWLHARGWIEHDHQPDPHQVPLGAARLICDFCGEPDPVFCYESSKNMTVIEGDLHRSLGHRWAGCRRCDPYVRAGDAPALARRNIAGAAFAAERAQTEARIGRAMSAQELRATRQAKTEVIGAYLPHVISRTRLPDPPGPPVRLPATRLPVVRTRLARLWATEHYRHTMADRARRGEPVLLPGADAGTPDMLAVTVREPDPAQLTAYGTRMARAVTGASLYWVSKAFTALAVRAGTRLGELSVLREDLPAVSGLIVYDDPIIDITVDGYDTPALVVAAGWTLVPAGVWLNLYAQPEQIDPGFARERHTTEGYLVPVGPGAAIGFGPHARTDMAGRTATAWGILLATWALMIQDGVADITVRRPSKRTGRVARRAGAGDPSVHLVDLIAHPHPVPHGQDGSGRVSGRWSVRVLVGELQGGFWRTYWSGPGRTVRVRRFVRPYPAGPADQPIAYKTDAPVVRVIR